MQEAIREVMDALGPWLTTASALGVTFWALSRRQNAETSESVELPRTDSEALLDELTAQLESNPEAPGESSGVAP